MESLNFTQFCKKFGYPDDYDTIFNAQLLGGRGLDGNISKRTIKKQDSAFIQMQAKNKEAKELFYNMVRNGEILDASGKLKKEDILRKEIEFLNSETQTKIKNLQNYIDFVKGMKTAYLKNGKLKKGYQLAVTENEEKIKQLLKN